MTAFVLREEWAFDELDALECLPLGPARLFVHRADGPAVLFVHGGYHGAWCWMPFLRLFGARSFFAGAVDLRGHGGQPQGSDFIEQGVLEMAEDVVAAGRALGRPVILVGHSVGALVAMAAVANFPFPVRGLALLAPSPPAQLPGLKPIDPYPEDEAVSPPTGDAARKKFLEGFDGDVSDFLSRLCPESPRLLNDRYQLRIRIEPENIPVPVFSLSAGRDRSHLHPPGQDEATAAFFGGEFHEIPEASHDMMLDAARLEAAGRILDWIDRRIAPA